MDIMENWQLGWSIGWILAKECFFFLFFEVFQEAEEFFVTKNT